MRRIIYFVALIPLVFLVCSRDVDDKAEAQKVAELWLKLLDEGKFEEAFEQFTDRTKMQINQDTWISLEAETRQKLGVLLSREINVIDLTDIPASKETPGGKYATIQYKVSFENRKEDFEAVGLIKEKNKKTWQVDCYLFMGLTDSEVDSLRRLIKDLFRDYFFQLMVR